MAKDIGLIVLIIFGAILFILGLRELSKNSFKGNLADIILSIIFDIFEYSGIGMLLIGLLLMVIGIYALVSG